MGSPNDSRIPAPLRPALNDAAQENGFIAFADYMRLALYHPEVGYYTRPVQRVGRTREADFFTASSLGSLFGELVVASASSLLGGEQLSGYTFVEVGAESGRSVLDDVQHPFAAVRAIGVGESAEAALSGRIILFSNELFDAQPCHRFINTDAGWLERGVRIVDDQLEEVRRPAADPGFPLPNDAPDGYEIDAPLAARDLAEALVAPDWEGLFLAFDYGKTWHELSRETPNGSLRAYHRHQQNTDVLSRITEQDLTCHICWDWIADALQKHRFSVQPVLSQEAFLVKNAGEFLARTMQQEAGQLSARKQALLQLLHPSALGQKFQALAAIRSSSYA